MKLESKRGLLFLFMFLFLLITLSSIFSVGINAQPKVDKAYTWLKSQASLSNYGDSIQNSFVLLGLSGTSQKAAAKNSLLSKAYQRHCWSDKQASQESDCNVWPTTLAKFALDNIGYDTSKINSWLLDKASTFKGINWFFQVDIERGLTANCTIIYDGGVTNVTINDDKTLTLKGTSNCFSVSDKDNYWLQLDSNCYDKKSFKVTCDISDPTKIFKINLLYKKPSNDIWHVVNEQWSEQSGHTSDISFIYSECLSESGSCNYEATSWFAYDLKDKQDSNYTRFLPYLTIAADNNQGFLPDSFLYLITSGQDYGNNLLNLENVQGFWLANHGQFYTTSLAALGLLTNYNYDYNVSQTKEYLLSRQSTDGSWQCNEVGCDSLRDTAFILWVFWPLTVGGGPGQNVTTNECADNGGTCEGGCDYDLYRTLPINYSCAGSGNTCCKPADQGYCVGDFGGSVCSEGQTCSGQTVETADEFACCIGQCITSAGTCSSQGGELCDMKQGSYCEQGHEIFNVNDTTNTLSCCDASYCVEKTCSDLQGRICTSDQTCKGTLTWSSDSYSEKSCCVGDCVVSGTCSENNGETCESGQCSGDTIKTEDTNQCCLGTCMKNCDTIGGEICQGKSYCQAGHELTAIESGCCDSGYCSKKSSKAWIGILFLILFIGGLIFFLYKKGIIKIKKKSKGKGPSDIPGIGFGPRPPSRPPRGVPNMSRTPGQWQPHYQQQRSQSRYPLRPLTPQPVPRPVVRPRPIARQPTLRTAAPLRQMRPTVVRRSKPATGTRMQVLQPIVIHQQPARSSVRSLTRPKTKTKVKTKTKGRVKKKTRTEEQLEKTLEKIKKLTSKK